MEKKHRRESVLAILKTAESISATAGIMITDAFLGEASIKPEDIPVWKAYLIFGLIILGFVLLAYYNH